MLRDNQRSEAYVIGVLLLVKLLLHLFTIDVYGPHRDELLYHAQGQHLAWGFASTPPLTGFLAWVSALIFGPDIIALRVISVLFGLASLLLVLQITRMLGGKNTALFMAGIAFILSPAFLRVNSLFMPVATNQFFWILIAYLMILLVRTRDTRYWWGIGIACGMAVLNKYSVAFFAISLFLGLIASRHRTLVFSKNLLIGIVLAFMISLPNLLWQYEHNWPVIGHMDELAATQLVNVSLSSFLIDQVFMNFPGIFIWIPALAMVFLIKTERRWGFIALTWVFLLLLLMVLRGKSYYTLGIYPLLFALGAYLIEKYASKGIRIAVIALTVLTAIPLVPIGLPILGHERLADYTEPMAAATNRWEDGRIHDIPQDFADMTGWEELAGIIGETYSALPKEEREECVIFCDNYGQAGAVVFYGKKYDLPPPICLNDAFVLWIPDTINFRSVITPQQRKEDISGFFDQVQLKGSVDDPNFRESGIKVYYCTGPNDSLFSLLDRRIKDEKRRYTMEQ